MTHMFDGYALLAKARFKVGAAVVAAGSCVRVRSAWVACDASLLGPIGDWKCPSGAVA